MENIDLKKEMGSRIRSLREDANLTREALAEKAEMSTQFLADIEMGRKGMSAITLMNLATTLYVSTDYIVFGTPCSGMVSIKESKLSNMLYSLDKPHREIAETILRAYIQAIDITQKKNLNYRN